MFEFKRNALEYKYTYRILDKNNINTVSLIQLKKQQNILKISDL